MFVALLSALVVLVEASMGSVANVRGQFAQIFTPVHALARLPVDLVDRLGASHRDMGQLQADLERLKVQNNMLLVRQQRMQALGREQAASSGARSRLFVASAAPGDPRLSTGRTGLSPPSALCNDFVSILYWPQNGPQYGRRGT